MIQRQPFPSSSLLPWQEHSTRQRVIHSAAQHTWYFLLGLTVVSLLIWLNLFLASETAALRMQIEVVQEKCAAQEQINAELVREIASATSIEQVEAYARNQGFIRSPRILYLALSEEELGPQGLAAASGSLTTPQEEGRKSAPEPSPWRTPPHRLRALLISPPSSGRVASRH